jgi:hypothetical protein
MEFAQQTARWEETSGAITKRDGCPQTYAHYVQVEDEEAAFFVEDFDTIRKDVPRTHAASFVQTDLSQLVAKSENMAEKTASGMLQLNGGTGIGILSAGQERAPCTSTVDSCTSEVAAVTMSAADMSLDRVLKAYVARNHNPGYAQVACDVLLQFALALLFLTHL